MTDSHAELQSGLTGSYVLERELGRGGMATVYLAHDRKHGRPVALKVLLPELALSLGPERFQREIHLAARLQHPHILTVLDSGETAGQLWFTMPYVEGESLRDRLRRERQLPVEDALRIAQEAARALDYAHQHGVIHRDIKPENILLTKDGSTLVADFGIARALGTDEPLTQTGMAIGTPAYMSPEQATGERALDARSDVFSLGAVVYEMLAGEAPWTGPTAQAILAKRFTEPAPSVRRLRPTVPEAIDLAIQRALAVVPADRFATAGLLAQALAPALTTPVTTPTIAVPPPAAAAGGGTPAGRRLVVGLAVCAFVALAGAVALVAMRPTGAGNPRSAGAAAARAPAAHGAGPVRIAVLPFDNLGDSADAYFADGVSDAVRGKLTELRGLEVIAGPSSAQYRGTTKSPRQIGNELGVQYLLFGRVRWARQKDGTSRVQVSPELIELGDGTERSRWQQPFDAPLTDVFEVQGAIASKVVSALDVALGTTEAQQLAQRPTGSLAAYDAYLQGEAIQGGDLASMRRRLAFYELAVAQDSTFGNAWARIASVASQLYSISTAKGDLAEKAQRALAQAGRLAPHSAETYRARASFEYLVREDVASTVAMLDEALARHPSSPDLLRLSALAQRLRGHTDQALLQLQRALELDPRSLNTARSLGGMLLGLGRPAQARAMYERCLELSPGDITSLHSRVETYLIEGDLAGARRSLADVPPTVSRSRLLAYMSTYDDLYWVLDAAQQDTVLALSPAEFDDDRITWALARAQIYYDRGDRARARLWADSARMAITAQLRLTPDDTQLRGLLGFALSLQGRFADAIREGMLAVARDSAIPASVNSPYNRQLLARTYTMAGQHDRALDLLEVLTQERHALKPGRLRIDPAFEPLKGLPRFARLIQR